jgi:hypothetical protein
MLSNNPRFHAEIDDGLLRRLESQIAKMHLDALMRPRIALPCKPSIEAPKMEDTTERAFWVGMVSDATRAEHNYPGYERQCIGIAPHLVMMPDGKPYLRWRFDNLLAPPAFTCPRPGDGLRWCVGYSLWTERDGGVCLGEQMINGTALPLGEKHALTVNLYLPLPFKGSNP